MHFVVKLSLGWLIDRDISTAASSCLVSVNSQWTMTIRLSCSMRDISLQNARERYNDSKKLTNVNFLYLSLT